jgi:spermidine synthase
MSEKRKSHIEIVDWQETKLGTLCLRRRVLQDPPEVVTEITINEEFLMSSYLTLSERTLSERALALHRGDGLRVMVGGLGLGYTAHEALKSDRVSSLEVVEFLPEVIGWTERELIPLAGDLKSEPRLSIVEDDVYARLLATPSTTYDLVLIDVDHAPDAPLGGASAAFYGEEGLTKARAHLSDGGVLGLWSYAEHSPFEEALRRVFSEVHVEPVTVFNDLIGEDQTDWLFFARG